MKSFCVEIDWYNIQPDFINPYNELGLEEPGNLIKRGVIGEIITSTVSIAPPVSTHHTDSSLAMIGMRIMSGFPTSSVI